MKKLLLVLIFIAVSSPNRAYAGYEDGINALRNSDHELALAILLPFAREGSANAQYNVGLLFQQGRGIKQNYKKASQWYLAAANQGHFAAQNNIGSLYRRGKGVGLNYKSAVYWYQQALQDSPLARNNLAFLYINGLGLEKNYASAARLLKWASGSGHVKSTFDLGKLYEMGHGVEKNKKKQLRCIS